MSAQARIPRIDLHTHSQVSDGHGTHDEIVQRARERGVEVVAITDHYDPLDPRLGAADVVRDPARLRTVLSLRDSVHRLGSECGVRVLVGVERGPLPAPRLGAADLDLVIGSVHYLVRPIAARPGDLYNPEFWQAYKEDVLRVAADPQVHVLGHIAGYLPMDPLLLPGSTFEERRAIEREIAARFFDRSWYEEVFRRVRDTGKAVELHCATRTPPPDAVKLGLDLGARFSIGSDAHSLDRVGAVDWALDLLESLGATRDDVYIPQVRPHPDHVPA